MLARTLLIALPWALVAFAARAAAAPTVIDARLDDTPAAVRDAARAQLGDLIGQPATPAAIAATVQALGRLAGVGGVSVTARRLRSGTLVDLTFTHDGRARRVGDVRFVLDGAALEPAASWRLHRRIEAGAGLFLSAGEPFHPYLLARDAAAIVGWYRDRGHRDAVVAPDVRLTDDLAAVVWRVDPGPAWRVARVDIAGLPPEVEPADLRTAPDEPLSAAAIDRDRQMLEGRLCRAGHPRAVVEVESHALAAEVPEADGPVIRRVAVRFVAEPGPAVRTGRVQIVGRRVPWPVQQRLALVEGAPFCPALVEEARRQIADFLRERGVPDPRIGLHTRTRLTPDGERVASVTFDVRRLADARIERIWFSGNQVTREDVLRQLTAISEGDLYRQGAVDATVQALRRSGLFRRVSAEVIEGGSPDRVFLTFRLQEREALGFDVTDARLILRNVDVTAWPEDFAAFEQGRAFRGAGQRVDLVGQPDAQSIAWRDDFVTRHLVARTAIARHTADNAGFESERFTLTGGPGFKILENAVNAVLLGEVESVSTTAKGGAALPVLEGQRFTGAVVLDGRADLTRRDDERIQYLGVEASLVGRFGGAIDGADLTWLDTLGRLRVHLPLWRTRRGQHWVLRLTARNRAVFTFVGAAEDLAPHRRLFPEARGYAAGELGLRFELPDGDTLDLGGLHAADGSVELRIPLPFGRRNAISPFLDAAAVADRPEELRDDVFTAAGLALAFSFFDERIEGVLWGAWPLRDDVEATYVGGSLGGNF